MNQLKGVRRFRVQPPGLEWWYQALSRWWLRPPWLASQTPCSGDSCSCDSLRSLGEAAAAESRSCSWPCCCRRRCCCCLRNCSDSLFSARGWTGTILGRSSRLFPSLANASTMLGCDWSFSTYPENCVLLNNFVFMEKKSKYLIWNSEKGGNCQRDFSS